MNISPIKTHKIVSGKKTLLEILDRYLQKPPEGSVLAITSKIVSICEGNVTWAKGTDKQKLIEQQADWYIAASKSKHKISISIKNGLLTPMAGIDESNANGFYILWPKDPQKTANEVRGHISKKFKLKNFGVIITDSKTTPLRYGTTGITLAHSGFNPLRNYIGTLDIFGRKLAVTKANIIDGLAASAVLAMGEGSEQTPLALISGIPFVKFQDRNPTALELKSLAISIQEDLYSPLLRNAPWEKGGKI